MNLQVCYYHRSWLLDSVFLEDTMPACIPRYSKHPCTYSYKNGKRQREREQRRETRERRERDRERGEILR